MHAGEVPVAYVTLAPGATVDRGRAARTGRASGSPSPPPRPRPVTVLDALPVTAVGKPYKLALRADATRTRRRRRRSPGSTGDADGRTPRIEDGTSVATVTVASGTDPSALGRP